ncbi:MAG: hypothetical protein HY822_03810 [Acidobacteria bacterium]|nr:hypothetical protein [Acidobacteriota bacterium]
MMKKLLLGLTTLALVTASAASYRVTLFQPSVINGTELKPGDYKIEHDAGKVVIRAGKQTVEAPVKVETSDVKFSATSVRYAGGGKNQVQEIRLGGTNTRLVFAN